MTSPPTGSYKFLRAASHKTEFQISKRAGIEQQGKKVFLPTFHILALQAERKKKDEREKRERESLGCLIRPFRKLFFVNQTLSTRIVFILLSLAETRSHSLMAEGIILTDEWVMKELTGQMLLLLHLHCTTICDHGNLGRMNIQVHPL